jgi:serine/threonine protein kinase
VVKVVKQSRAEWKEAWNEAKLIAAAQHTNVVMVYETSFSNDLGAIIMARWESSLDECLERLDAQQRASVAFQLSSGLVAIHGANILHRDINCFNALVTINDDDGKVRACWTDFGLATFGLKTIDACIGTAGYIAPEIAENDSDNLYEYNVSTDVYAFGVVLAVIVSDQPEFFDKDDIDTYIVKRFEKLDFKVDMCSHSVLFKESNNKTIASKLLSVIKQACDNEPSERPNMYSIERQLCEILKYC